VTKIRTRLEKSSKNCEKKAERTATRGNTTTKSKENRDKKKASVHSDEKKRNYQR